MSLVMSMSQMSKKKMEGNTPVRHRTPSASKFLHEKKKIKISKIYFVPKEINQKSSKKKTTKLKYANGVLIAKTKKDI